MQAQQVAGLAITTRWDVIFSLAMNAASKQFLDCTLWLLYNIEEYKRSFLVQKSKQH